MKNTLLLFAVCFTTGIHAQYYYNDIIGTKEIAGKMNAFIANKVKSVSAIGYDERGVKSTDYNEWQEIKENGKALKITTREGFNKTILYYRFDAEGKLSQLIDSSSGTENSATYKYDNAGRLIRIENTTNDPATGKSSEVHDWIYNNAGKPEKLWRVLNGNDSTEIRFTLDENGNVAEEQMYKRGKGTDPVYYYYDDSNRLTDIVRFNKKANRLLPDAMFEYDDNNRVIQKITPLSSLSLGYLTWRYIYDARGLKTKEALFNKNKELTGKIDYQYVF